VTELPDWLIFGLLLVWMLLDRFDLYFRREK
jgi:hypothetical protein